MTKSIAVAMAAVVAVSVVVAIALICGDQANAPEDRGTRPDRGPLVERVSGPVEPVFSSVASLSPQGEWWARGQGFLVRAKLVRGAGRAAIYADERVSLHVIRVFYPEGLIDVRKIQYRLWSDKSVTEWYGAIPAFAKWKPRSSESFAEGHRIDEIRIEYGYGPFGDRLAPFTLFLTSKFPPASKLSATEMVQFERMGRMLSSSESIK